MANDQRKVVYEQRNELLDTNDISETIHVIRDDVYGPSSTSTSRPSPWKKCGTCRVSASEVRFPLDLPLQQWLAEDDKLAKRKLRERIPG